MTQDMPEIAGAGQDVPRRDVPGLRRFGIAMDFKSAVIALGVVTLLVFIGGAVSARIAFLFAALLALAGVLWMEMTSRRRWEAAIIVQMRKMFDEYDRLVRETARNRNDLSTLRKNLADAGALVRSYGHGAGEDVGQRMMRALSEQLTRMGSPLHDAGAADEAAAAADISIAAIGTAEKDAPLVATDERNIGSRLGDEQVSLLVQAAVRQDRIDLFLQPIVNLPQRKLRFYEMFSRIRIKPEVYLPAERYIEVAMRNDLVPVIDNLLLLRGLQMLRDTEEENFNRAFFCNITSLTLNDPKFMGDLVEFIAQNRTLAPRLVFEFSQADLAGMSADTLPTLQGLARLGCRFSMDRVSALSFDFAHLEARHIRFIKVDSALVLDELRETGGLQRMKRLKSELDRHGIDLIVEKIETDRQLLELLDIEIDYGQGYLFGKPHLYEKTP